jgi:hypothetical protein
VPNPIDEPKTGRQRARRRLAVTDYSALERSLSRPSHPWYTRLAAWVAGWVLWIVLTLLFRSCRVYSFGDDILERSLRENGNRVLGAIWHRNLLYIVYVFSRYRAVIMASRSRDGEIIAQTLKRFRHLAPRGSRNDGGAKALLEMTRLIAAGNPGGLALDASTGPPYVAKPGIIRLAADSGAVIIPMSWWAEPCWRLKGWDMTIIPKPFSRIVFAYGEPLVVPVDVQGPQIEPYRAELERRLHRLTYQVDHWFPLRDHYADPRTIPVPDPVPIPVHPPRVHRKRKRGRVAERRTQHVGPES